jgi:hypothetical protein
MPILSRSACFLASASSLSRVNRIRRSVCSLGPGPSCSRVNKHGALPAWTFKMACRFSGAVLPSPNACGARAGFGGGFDTGGGGDLVAWLVVSATPFSRLGRGRRRRLPYGNRNEVFRNSANTIGGGQLRLRLGRRRSLCCPGLGQGLQLGQGLRRPRRQLLRHQHSP